MYPGMAFCVVYTDPDFTQEMCVEMLRLIRAVIPRGFGMNEYE